MLVNTIEPNKTEKSLSLVALDWLNFFLAPIRAGLASYLPIYFTHKGFTGAQVGMIIATLALTAAIATTPAGQFVDKYPHKRHLMAANLFLFACCVLAMIFLHDFRLILLTQVCVGIVCSIMAPTLGAISLGLVGHDRMAGRLGRNDAYNHAGSVAVAAAVGFLGLYFPVESMFCLVLFLCTACMTSVLVMKDKDVNEAWATGLTAKENIHQAPSVKSVIKSPGFLVFLISVLLFNLTNGTLLPLVLERIVHFPTNGSGSLNSFWPTSCIIVAELVMIFTAIFSGQWASKGRKPLLLACYAALALRALIFAVATGPALLVAGQIFDGVSAGVFGVISITIVSDLAYGSGHFNLSQGITYAFCAIGAAASNYLGGMLADKLGFEPACFILMFTGIAGFIFVAKFMPETKDRGRLSSSI
jgi:predicted MFS family arabinose efflux permease